VDWIEHMNFNGVKIKHVSTPETIHEERDYHLMNIEYKIFTRVNVKIITYMTIIDHKVCCFNSPWYSEQCSTGD
jgi:hypothetical protein